MKPSENRQVKGMRITTPVCGLVRNDILKDDTERIFTGGDFRPLGHESAVGLADLARNNGFLTITAGTFAPAAFLYTRCNKFSLSTFTQTN